MRNPRQGLEEFTKLKKIMSNSNIPFQTIDCFI
jgi:hypothetical protein